MAKKRKKDKQEEEYEFTPPEFDEKEFLRKELRDTKTVLLTVAYAAMFGVVAGVLSNFNESLAAAGLVLVVGGLFSLKYFYQLIKVDVSEFQKKNWAGNIAFFFFTFLAIWILTFNFPFADHADPSISKLTVWVDDGMGNTTAIEYEYSDSQGGYVWVPRWDEDLGTVIHASASYTVNITAKVADNGELSTVTISVNGGAFADMTSEGDHRFGYELTGDQLSTELKFLIRATDAAGHSKELSVSAIPVSA